MYEGKNIRPTKLEQSKAILIARWVAYTFGLPDNYFGQPFLNHKNGQRGFMAAESFRVLTKNIYDALLDKSENETRIEVEINQEGGPDPFIFNTILPFFPELREELGIKNPASDNLMHDLSPRTREAYEPVRNWAKNGVYIYRYSGNQDNRPIRITKSYMSFDLNDPTRPVWSMKRTVETETEGTIITHSEGRAYLVGNQWVLLGKDKETNSIVFLTFDDDFATENHSGMICHQHHTNKDKRYFFSRVVMAPCPESMTEPQIGRQKVEDVEELTAKITERMKNIAEHNGQSTLFPASL